MHKNVTEDEPLNVHCPDILILDALEHPKEARDTVATLEHFHDGALRGAT